MNFHLFYNIYFGLTIYRYKDELYEENLYSHFIDLLSLKIVDILFLGQKFTIILFVYSMFYSSGRFFVWFAYTCLIMIFLSILYRLYIACSRYSQEVYHKYYISLQEFLKEDMSQDQSLILSDYYTDFMSLPISYSMKYKTNRSRNNSNPMLAALLFPLAYLLNIIVFPGASTLFNTILYLELHDLRSRSISTKTIRRVKVETPDNYLIDVYYNYNKGPYLVILSNGNGEYAEYGSGEPFHQIGYSTINWNYPGFACSTGSTYSDSIKNSIETVINYSIDKLRYPPENIIVNGFSIGGFATSYISSVFPQIKAVILNAPFDHISNFIPKILTKNSVTEKIVDIILRNYYDLDVIGNVLKWNKNIKIIVKTKDDIILTRRNDYNSNMGIRIIEDIVKKQILNEIPNFPVKDISFILNNIPYILPKYIDTPYQFNLPIDNFDELFMDKYKCEQDLKNLVNSNIKDILEKVSGKIVGPHEASITIKELENTMKEFIET